MIHKLLAGKGRMKKGLSLLLCLALLGSSVISANVTAEAESDVTVEAVEIAETDETEAAETADEAETAETPDETKADETVEEVAETETDEEDETAADDTVEEVTETETTEGSGTAETTYETTEAENAEDVTEQAPEEVQTETEETAAENSAESTAEVNGTVMETSVDNSTEAEADETVAETVEEDGTGEVAETVETDTAEQSSAVTETSSKESTKIVSEAAAKTDPSEESGYSETVTVDGITVEATAEVGVFPAGTTMTVTLLSADDETADQYSEAEAALEESGIEYDGFVALDISFFGADGNKIEPEQGSVTVKMNVEASLLDEDMDTDSLAVQHLAESDNGSIEVQTVADVADETDGTVTVGNEAVTAEFEVESFSTYTVTWTSNIQTKKAVLYFYDESGNDISEALGISGSQTVSGTGSLTDSGSNGEDGLDVVGKTYNGKSGYYYVTAHLDSVEGTTATDISYNNGWNYYSGDWYKWTDSNGSQKTDNTVNVYLIYTKDTLTTVETVDSESMGITIRMIDYYAAAQLTSGSSSYDSIIGGDYYTNNGGVTQNLLRRVLGNDGYPVTANGISLAELFSGGTEVNYLFLESTYEETGYLEYSSFENYAYLGSSSNFTVYEQIGTPSNEESYFYMRGNFMPYNAIVNGGFSTNTNLYDEDGNALTESDDRYDENLYKTQGTNDYEFGMYLEAEFYQPENGKVESAGEMVDMRYEFNGDDDLWVYIDDVLVLDIGGIHDAHSGYIDFATGVVHVELGDIDNDGVADVQNTTIKAMFKEAGVFPDGTAWDDSLVNEYFDGDTFADYTAHTLKMFYMERGAGASNLHMKFNLPIIEESGIQVKKELSNTDKENYADVEFAFQVYLQEVASTDASGNQTYSSSYVQLTNSLMSTENITVTKTDNSGNTSTLTSLTEVTYNGTTYYVFYLKPGETATISGLQMNRLYYVAEVGVESEYYDTVLVNHTAVYGYDDYGDQIEETEGVAQSSVAKVQNRYLVTFTNNCSAANSRELRITKEMTSGQTSDDTFSFYIELEDQDGYLADYSGSYYLVKYTTNGDSTTTEYFYYNNEGTLTSSGTTAVVCGTTTNGIVSGVPVGYTVVLTQILSGTSFRVTELVSDEYLDTDTYSAEYTKTLVSGTYSIDGKVEGSDGEILLGKDAEVTITNSLKNTTITVIKEVTGNMGDETKKFSFSLTDANSNELVTGGFELSDGEKQENISAGIGSTITLSETNNSGYTVTVLYGSLINDNGTYYFNKTDGAYQEVNYTNGKADITVSADYDAILVINDYDIDPDTGIDLDSLPYLLMLAGVAVLGGVVLFGRRRRLL